MPIKKLGRDLVMTSELEMVEVVGNFTGQKVGPIFFRGQDPIDGGVGHSRRGGHRDMRHASGIWSWGSQDVGDRLFDVIFDRLQPT